MDFACDDRQAASGRRTRSAPWAEANAPRQTCSGIRRELAVPDEILD